MNKLCILSVRIHWIEFIPFLFLAFSLLVDLEASSTSPLACNWSTTSGELLYISSVSQWLQVAYSEFLRIFSMFKPSVMSIHISIQLVLGILSLK